MKKNVASKVLAGTLALTMVLGMAACGNNDGDKGSSGSNTPKNTAAPQGSGSTATQQPSTPDNSGTTEVDYMSMPPMKLVISLPGDCPYTALGQNADYDRLVKEINEKLNVDITWQFEAIGTYYDRLSLKYAANDVADMLVVGADPTFFSAALGGSYESPKLNADGTRVMQDKKDENGNLVYKKDKDGNPTQEVEQEAVMEKHTLSDPMFWDLTDYLKDYDNLATIPQGALDSVSLNGRSYSLPRSRNAGRNGWGYRQDWLNNLGLKEPETWDEFKEMLKQFTENDPDRNGINDTVGLFLDSWGDAFEVMQAWFGVPNDWGLDKDGNLIYYCMTEEYKTFMKEMHELYDLGYINKDFDKLSPGDATKVMYKADQNPKGGVTVQVLDDLRKVETRICADGIAGSVADTEDEDELTFTLRTYILTDSGKNQPLRKEFGAASNAIALSNTGNIKTEDDLKRALWVLNKFNDGDILNLIEYGWEGITYELDENGYVTLWQTTKEDQKAKLDAAGVTDMKYNQGFNQIPTYFTADANERPVTTAPATSAIRKLEDKLKFDQNYLVTNLGAGLTSEYYSTNGQGEALETIITDARLKYVKGEIDENAFDAAMKQWWTAGGEIITREMNELYKAKTGQK